MSLIVRDATLEDAEDILAIYNYAAINTTAVWTDGPADLDSRREWMRARQAAGYPVLVAMRGCDVVGFASFGDFRPWPGYRHTVENSVYVAPDAQGKGVGRVLLAAVVEACTAKGYRLMVAIIGDSANFASITLHRRAGFRFCGTIHSVGHKFGRWLDSVVMELPLGDGDCTIPPER